MGLYHDFWLLEEKTYPYSDYDKFLIRKDAPIRIHQEIQIVKAAFVLLMGRLFSNV